MAGRGEAVVEERRWRLRRVAFDRVLDERGAMGGQDPVEFVQTRDRVRSSTARGEVEIGRRLEALPALAAKAEAGEPSFDQLEQLVELATPETDAEWARRGAQSRAERAGPSRASATGGDRGGSRGAPPSAVVSVVAGA